MWILQGYLSSICLLAFSLQNQQWKLGSFFTFLCGISSKSLVVAVYGKWFLCDDITMHKKEAAVCSMKLHVHKTG